MPINVQLQAPAANGSPLPGVLLAQIVGFAAGQSVMFVVVDEADGAKTHPPLPGVLAGGGNFTALVSASAMAQHFYTVVVVAVETDNMGNIVNTGSDAKIKCRYL